MREHFNYDTETGVISRIRKGAKKNAGTVSHEGYIRLMFNGRYIQAHRLAWFLHYGEWPELAIDHINGDRTDNRISNLRLATTRQNLQNTFRHRSGKLVGTCFDKSRGNWIASAMLNGRRKNLGRFATEEEAHRVYMEATSAS